MKRRQNRAESRTRSPGLASAFHFVVVVAAGAGALGFAAPARAIEAGGTCTLHAPLSLTIHRKAGTVEETLDKGTVVELVSVGDGGLARVNAGEVKGTAQLADLDSACSGTLRMCTLRDAMMMYEQNRSDSKSWRVKPGADVSILKRGKTWAAVRVGDLQGFVKTEDIGACVAKDTGSASPDEGDGEGDAPARAAPAASGESVDRGEGPGVLLLPFATEGTAPIAAADAFLDVFAERAQYYRPDAGRLGPDASRNKPLKDQITAAAKRAFASEMAYVVVGRLSVEAPTKEAPLEDRYVLQLAMVDAKTAKVLKGIRVRPTTKAADPWAEKSLASLLPAIATAPGAKTPAPPSTPGFEMAPNPGLTAPPPSSTKRTEAEPYQEAPWFSNVWGYLALGGAVVAGAGSGVAGVLALDENDRANAAVQTDTTRSDHRNTALAEAVTADSLGVVAAGAVVASVVVFASRAGLE